MWLRQRSTIARTLALSYSRSIAWFSFIGRTRTDFPASPATLSTIRASAKNELYSALEMDSDTAMAQYTCSVRCSIASRTGEWRDTTTRGVFIKYKWERLLMYFGNLGFFRFYLRRVRVAYNMLEHLPSPMKVKRLTFLPDILTSSFEGDSNHPIFHGFKNNDEFRTNSICIQALDCKKRLWRHVVKC